VLALAWLVTPVDAARRSGKDFLDPVGAWSCVLYGHPAFGDERVLLRFEPNGTAGLARPSEDTRRPWAPLSSWTVARNVLTFSDSRTGRQFEGDLERATLGGTWRTLSLLGGWWCSPMDDAIAAETAGVEIPAAAPLMPPLIPERMATPSYPRQAIREAKEGRTVTCFFVDAAGNIIDPEVLEISDEIFREPTLAALGRSRYRGWPDEGLVRPGCRSYIYRLDAVLY
jgi:hypothetical protein